MAVYDLAFIVTTILLAFDLSLILDGIFLKRNEKSTYLTIFGWLYFGVIFFIINSMSNFFILIFQFLKKRRNRKFRWFNILNLPKWKKFAEFRYAVFFYLIEIVTGILAGFEVTPAVIFLTSQSKFYLIPLLIITICCFAILFFRALPYKNKSMPFIIISWIIIAICIIITAIFVYQQFQSVSILSNATNQLNHS